MPTVLDELIVQTKVDLSGLQAGLRQAEAEVAATRARFAATRGTTLSLATNAEAEARAIGRTTSALQGRMAAMVAETTAIRSGIAVGQSYRQIQEQIATATKEAELRHRGFGDSAATLARQYGVARGQLLQQHDALRAYHKQLQDAEGSHRSWGDTLSRTGRQLETTGTTLTTRLTLPIVAAGAAAIKAAADFDKLFAQMVGLAGVSPQVAEALRPQVLAMAPQVGKPPAELAEALYFIFSSGIKDASQAMEILRTSAQAGAAGLGEVKTIADVVTSALNVYGQSGLTAADATGVLVAAVREGKGEASAFAPVMGRVLAIANEMGVSFPQVAASIAMMTRVGLPAEEAATAVRRIILDLGAPAPKARDMFATLGTSARELQTILRTGGLLDVLLKVRDLTKGDLAKERAIFPDIRGLVGQLNLTGANVEQARQVFQSLRSAGAADLATAFGSVSEQPFFRAQQAHASMTASMVRFGEAIQGLVAGQLGTLASQVETLSKAFNSLSLEVQRGVTLFLEMVALAGPVAFFGGSILRLAGWFTTLAIAIRGLPAALPAWMSWAMGTVGKFPGGGAGLGAAALPFLLSGDNQATKRSVEEKIAFQESELQKQLARDTGVFGIGAVNPDDDPLVQNLRKGIADLKAHRANAEMRGALVGAVPATFPVAPLTTGGARPGALAGPPESEGPTAAGRRQRKQAVEEAADEAKRFLHTVRDKERALDQSTQRQLQGIRQVERAQVRLMDTEIESVRRQIARAREKGAPNEVLLGLYQRELDLIEKKKTAEITGAQQSLAAIHQEMTGNAALIRSYDERLRQLQEKKSAGPPTPVQATEEKQLTDGRQALVDKTNQLRDAEQSWGDAQHRATTQALSDTDRVIAAQNELTMSVGERIRRQLGEDARQSSQTFATIWVHGIDRVSDALSDMVAKGKFSFQGLAQIANATWMDIQREMTRALIRSLITGEKMQGVEAGGGFLSLLFGGGGTRGSVMSGGAPRSYMPPADAAQVQWQLATTGIQQLATVGTTATQMLTQASSGSFSLLSQLAATIISSIQALATDSSASSAGGGFLGMLGGLFGMGGGGSSFGNVIAGGSSTAAILHSGGVIPHFAGGGFVGNEVPAILHKGEMVLSAAETRNLMRYGSAKLPIGGGAGSGARSHSGGNVYNTHMTIHTPDANSFMRNKSQISAQMARQMRYDSQRNN